MAKLVAIIIIAIVIVIAIVFLFSSSLPFGLTPSAFAGPGGCSTGEECSEFCRQNPEVCEAWCRENPGACPEEHLTGPQGGPGPLQEGFTGPGGCTGPDCEAFCSQNPVECQKWCDENPETCAIILGGGQQEPPVGAPETVIAYSKSVNIIADQGSEEDIVRANGLGANIVTIWPANVVQDNEVHLFLSRGNVQGLINTAHRNGLQVELRSSFSAGTQVTDLGVFRESARKYVAELAKFAEERNVYRIIPFGEMDNNLVNYPGNITEVSQLLLAEAKEHYRGKIGIGIAAPWRDSGYMFTGYDYMTVSAYPQIQTGADAWLTTAPEINVHNVISGAREVANRSGIQDLYLGETGVYNPGESHTGFETATVSKDKEAEYYRMFFETLSEKVEGVSVFYGSPAMSVKGDPAEAVVRDWFAAH